MAQIRSVLKHPSTGKWAYIQYSDEEKGMESILGGKEFDTQDEAWEYSKGFAPFEYEWKDPIETKRKNLLQEKEEIEKRLKEINDELV